MEAASADQAAAPPGVGGDGGGEGVYGWGAAPEGAPQLAGEPASGEAALAAVGTGPGIPLMAYAGHYDARLSFHPTEVALCGLAEMRKRPSGALKRLVQGEERRVPCFLCLEGGHLYAFKGRSSTALRAIFSIRDFEFADGTEDTPAHIPTVVARSELYEERFYFKIRSEVTKWVEHLNTTELERWRLWAVHERLRANALEQKLRDTRAEASRLEADLDSLTGKEIPAREADLEELRESLKRGKEANSQYTQDLDRLTRDIDELAHENTLLRGRAEERESLLQDRTAAYLAVEEKLEIAESEREGWMESQSMLQADLENAQEDRELLAAQLSDLQVQVDERDVALGAVKGDLRDKIQELESGRIEVIQLQERAHMCEDRMKDALEKVADLQKDTLESTVTEARLRAEFEIARKDLDAARAREDSLKERLAEVESEVKSARSSVWDARKEADAQKQRADECMAQCIAAEEQLKETNIALEGTTEKVKSNESKVHALNARLVDFVDQVEAGRTRLREREESELKTIEMLSQETLLAQELRGEVARLQDEMNNVYGEHRAMSEEVRKAHRALAASGEQNTKLTARVEAFDAYSLKHSAEKTAFQTAMGRAHREAGSFQSQLAGTEIQAHRLEDLLGSSIQDQLSLERENARLHGELRALKSTASFPTSPSGQRQSVSASPILSQAPRDDCARVAPDPIVEALTPLREVLAGLEARCSQTADDDADKV